jgi:flagellar protein FliS
MNVEHCLEKDTDMNVRGDINPIDPMQTILMVYDGAIKFLSRAVEYADAGDIKNKNIYINKAADIIVELNRCLDMEVGGEISENLRAIYVFIGRLLVESFATDKTWGLKESIKILSELKEGWTYVANNINKATQPLTTFGN